MEDIVTIENQNTRDLRLGWRAQKVFYIESGLMIGQWSVVEYWEKDAQEKMAVIASSQSGNILEIGYGLGMASQGVVLGESNQHWIIEAHPEIANKARGTFKSDRVKVLDGFWEDMIDSFANEYFSAVIFDPFPMEGIDISDPTSSILKMVQEFWSTSQRKVRKGGILSFLDYSSDRRSMDQISSVLVPKPAKVTSSMIEIQIPPNCGFASGNSCRIITITY